MRIQLNVAVTAFVKTKIPRFERKFNKFLNVFEDFEVKEEEKELTQYFVRLNKLPVSEETIDLAVRDMKKQLKHECKQLGLVR